MTILLKKTKMEKWCKMKYPYKKNKMAKQENKGDIFQSGTIKNKSTFIF